LQRQQQPVTIVGIHHAVWRAAAQPLPRREIIMVCGLVTGRTSNATAGATTRPRLRRLMICPACHRAGAEAGSRRASSSARAAGAGRHQQLAASIAAAAAQEAGGGRARRRGLYCSGKLRTTTPGFFAACCAGLFSRAPQTTNLWFGAEPTRLLRRPQIFAAEC
jgi:hypothetical protein